MANESVAGEFFSDWIDRCERMRMEETQATKWTNERIEKLAESIVAHRALLRGPAAAKVPLVSEGNVIDARARFVGRE